MFATGGRDVYQTTRGDQDYQEHSVEIDFNLERGQSIEPDMEKLRRLAEEVTTG